MGNIFRVQSWCAGTVAVVFTLTAIASPTNALAAGFWMLLLYSFAGPLAIVGQERYGAQLGIFVVFWTLLLGVIGDESARLLHEAHQSGDATAVFLAPTMLMPIAIVLSLILHACARKKSGSVDSSADKPSLAERLEKKGASLD
jgi:hypothetical protein